MKKNEDVVIIYDEKAESVEKKILSAFEKYLELGENKVYY